MLTDVMNFCIYHIFKFRQKQKCQHCQLCVLRENSINAVRITSAARMRWHELSQKEHTPVRVMK